MLRFSALIVVLMCLSGLSGVMGVFKRADPFESYGVVMLDSVIWDKVVPNYNSNTVVMVCAKGSIGKQETDSIRDHFMDMGEYSGMQHNILYSQIIVNGAENAMMVNKKFGITNPNKELKRPKFFIYLPGSETPISLQTREIPEPDPTDLTYLITKHTGTRFMLIGTTAELDKLGVKFMSAESTSEEKVQIIADAQKLIDETADEKKKENYEWYVKIMNKITEKGEGFAATELDRLKSIVDSDKVSDDRKGTFIVRVNILSSAFVFPDEVPAGQEKVVGDDGSLLA